MRKIYSILPVLLFGISIMGQNVPAIKQLNNTEFSNINPQNLTAKESNEFEFYEKPYQGVNIPKSSITDSEGNTYITGTSSHADFPQGNMLTVKYNAEGELVWEKREETVDFVAESGFAIALDQNNNPIVSGISWNGDNMDIRTAKYDKSTGESIWNSTFDGGYEGMDSPQAITVDNQGNVIVTGFSYSENPSEAVNYVTLKYNSDGEFLWSQIDENDIENVWIQPYAVATDQNGNIAVTGYGSNSGLYQVYYTIKYSAEGDLIWKKKYDYTDNGNPTNSIASDVKFDENGNCFVTGTLNDSSGISLIGTIKYAENGDEEWVKTYSIDGQTTLGYQLEVSGNNLYVAGLHRGSWEAQNGSTLLSYSTNDGAQNWVQNSDGLIISGDEIGSYVHLTMNDSLPVISVWGENDMGHAIQIRKYNTDGTLNSEKNYTKEYSDNYSLNGIVGLGADENNSVYISFMPRYTVLGEAFEIAKFEENESEPIWDELYSNMGSSNTIFTKALPGLNGATVTSGYNITFDENGVFSNNFNLINYNSDGEVVWEKEYTPENGYNASLMFMNLDSEKNIYILLFPEPFGMETNLTLQKLSPDGMVLWEAQKELIFPQQYIEPIIDNNGNVYIAGASYAADTDSQAIFNVIKYDSEGNEEWSQFINSGNDEDNIYLITSGDIDNEGNLILAGETGTGSFFSQTTYSTVLKVNPEGELDWIQTYTSDEWNSGATGVFTNEENQIFVCGWKENSLDINQGEMIVMKYDANGELLWDNSYNEPQRRIRSYAIKPTSDNGFVAVAFSNELSTQTNRVIAVKFDAGGEVIWNRSSTDFQFYRDFYIDELDNVYVLNQEYSTTNPKRYFYSAGPLTIGKLLKISADGETSVETFVGDALSPIDPGDMVPFDDGRLLIGSGMYNESGHFEGIKFFETTHETLGTDDVGANDLSGNWLGQNYPNPSRNTTSIPFGIEESDKVEIRLFDMQGKFIRILKRGNFSEGTHSAEVNLSGIPSGIYFYQLKSASGFSKTKKMIVNQ